MPLRLKRNLMRVGAKIIIAVFMTVAGGILVGAILLRSLLFYPETLQPAEPDETTFREVASDDRWSPV